MALRVLLLALLGSEQTSVEHIGAHCQDELLLVHYHTLELVNDRHELSADFLLKVVPVLVKLQLNRMQILFLEHWVRRRHILMSEGVRLRQGEARVSHRKLGLRKERGQVAMLNERRMV